MRHLTTKSATVALIAGLALSTAACKKSEPANAADTNMTDMNTMDSSAGMTNDMSATDAMGADANTGGGLDNGTGTGDAGGNAANTM